MIPDLCPAFAPARAPRTYRPVFLRRRIDDLSTAADFSLFLSLVLSFSLPKKEREREPRSLPASSSSSSPPPPPPSSSSPRFFQSAFFRLFTAPRYAAFVQSARAARVCGTRLRNAKIDSKIRREERGTGAEAFSAAARPLVAPFTFGRVCIDI